MNQTGVIFDLDGTLVASETTYLKAWHAVARETGERMTDGLYVRLMGFNRADTIDQLADVWGSVARATRFVDLAQQRYEQEAAASGHAVRCGVRELLDHLAGHGVPLAVATSSHRCLAEAMLADTGLARYFRALVGGDEVERGKPSPEIYLAAAARLGVSPSGSLAFEDTSVGTDAALTAGMAVVLVPELPLIERVPCERVHRFADHAAALAGLARVWPAPARTFFFQPSSP